MWLFSKFLRGLYGYKISIKIDFYMDILYPKYNLFLISQMTVFVPNNSVHFNWTMKKSSVKLPFSKVTFQRTIDDQFIEMDDSLFVHASKHPEVLHLLGWRPEELILIGRKTLKKEYLRGVNLILKESNANYKNGRGLDRYEIEVPMKGETWLVVLEQARRNLGSKKAPCWVPLGKPSIVTCYPRGRKLPKFSVNPNFLFQLEYLRLASVLFTECEEFLMDKYEIWTAYISCDFQDWEEEVSRNYDMVVSKYLALPDFIDSSRCEESSWSQSVA